MVDFHLADIALENWCSKHFAMSGSSTKVEAEGYSFDASGLLNLVGDNLWLVLLLLAIAFIFFIFRKGAFAEKLLESRNRKHELDARQVESLRHIADTLSKKYEGDQPFLPLPDFTDKKDED